MYYMMRTFTPSLHRESLPTPIFAYNCILTLLLPRSLNSSLKRSFLCAKVSGAELLIQPRYLNLYFLGLIGKKAVQQSSDCLGAFSTSWVP